MAAKKLMSPGDSKDKELLNGLKAGSPIAIGYLPIALAFGAVAHECGIHFWAAVFMSLCVFAGASQFMAVSMFLSGAGVLQIVIATFFLNLRHIIMSMAVMDRVQDLPGKWKLTLSFGITDETFALLTLKSTEHAFPLTRFFLAAFMGGAYLAWVGGTALGSVFAPFIPEYFSSGMSIALYAMFIGLLVPAVKRNLKVTFTALAGMFLCFVLNEVMDTGWAVICATILGAVAGALIKGRSES